MNAPNENLPKTPPFIFGDAPERATNPTPSQPLPRPKTPARYNSYPSDRGMLSVAMFLISSLSMGIGLLGGAWIGFGVLQNGVEDFGGLLAGLLVAGLAYGVGWLVGLFGIRMLGNVILPIAMKAYAWIILAGLSALQIAIISKLFEQDYYLINFFKYVILFCAGLAALVGVHLIIEDHNLAPFSFPILIISLFHLYFIVFHYIFVAGMSASNFDYEYVLGDAAFFLLTSVLGVLMLAHLGILSSIRKTIDRFFEEKTIRFVPPS